jgi:hypothetical protein
MPLEKREHLMGIDFVSGLTVYSLLSFSELSLSWFVTNNQYSLAVLVPFGMSVTLRVPILASLKQTPANILVLDEGQVEIWMHQKFHSEPGITKGLSLMNMAPCIPLLTLQAG